MISIAARGKWTHKFIFLIVLICLVILSVIFYSENGLVKQTMKETITKIKHFTGIGEMNISSPEFSPHSTLDPFSNVSSGDEQRDMKEPIQFSALDRINKVIMQRFDERSALKKKVCNTPPYKDLSNQTKSINDRMSSLGKKRIRFCRIPKVGTTYLQSLERNVLRDKTNNSGIIVTPKTLVVVREPYSRLVSGYMGKIVTNPPWQRSYGASITRKFRPLASDKAKRCGHDVSYPEFIKYFIDAETTGWKRDLHFVPIYDQCNPCSKHYDFIGHLETIKDDLAYVLKSVNISVDMDFSDEELTMKGKADTIISNRNRIVKCETMCSAMSKVWWSFQARGLISTKVPFSLKEEECMNITVTEFADMSWNAHLQSAGRIDKSKQRRESLVNLYLQVPLEDRLKVQELMRKDFELYGYDPQPDDLFPELKQSS